MPSSRDNQRRNGYGEHSVNDDMTREEGMRNALLNEPFPNVPLEYEAAQSTRRQGDTHFYPENGYSGRPNDTGAAGSPPRSNPSSTFSEPHRRIPSSSTTDPNPSDEGLHTIHVCRQTRAGLVLVYHTTVEYSVIKEQSVVLYDKIKESQMNGSNISKVLVDEPITAEAVEMMIKLITGGIPQWDRTPMPFNHFLDLSIACWNFKTSTVKLQHWAESLHDHAWEFDKENGTPGRFRGWMFLSLIFRWSVVFEMASFELITEHKLSDDALERKKFLPEELEDAIKRKRGETLSKTYNFVHQKWLSLYQPDRRNPLFDFIAQELNTEISICIKESQSDKLDSIVTSGKFLRVFESIIQRTLDKCHGMHPPPPAETIPSLGAAQRASSNESRRKTGKLPTLENQYNNVRGGLIRDVLSQYEVKEELKSIFRRPKPKPQPPPKEEPKDDPMEGLEDVCKTLLVETREFRTESFRGLDIQKFLWLRDAHVPP